MEAPILWVLVLGAQAPQNLNPKFGCLLCNRRRYTLQVQELYVSGSEKWAYVVQRVLV